MLGTCLLGYICFPSVLWSCIAGFTDQGAQCLVSLVYSLPSQEQVGMVLYVICEYEDESTDDNVRPRFSIIDIHDEASTDYTFLVDRNARFLTLDGARYHIAGELDVDPDEVELKEV